MSANATEIAEKADKPLNVVQAGRSLSVSDVATANAGHGFNSMGSSKRSASVLQIARNVHAARQTGNQATTGNLRLLVNVDQILESVLEVIEYVENCTQPPILWPVGASMDHDFSAPWNYEKSLVILAREIDAHPWGAFGINHLSTYLPFLQLLASDLMSV